MRTGRRLAALVLALGYASPVAAQDEIGIVRGSTPEAVEIEDLDGNPVSLGEFIGTKPVLIEFWATWCENCEALQPLMDAAYETYGDRVEFIAIAVAVGQSTRRVKRHLERHPTGYRYLWDTRGRAVRAFKAPATSYVVALDADGRVVYTGHGADQNIDEAVRMALGQ